MTAYSWNSPRPGNWSTASDWTPGGGPPSTSADTVVISINGMAAVILDVNETIGALSISNSGDVLEIGGNQLTVTNAGGQAGTVTLTAGEITISGGTLSATNGISVATTLTGTGTSRRHGQACPGRRAAHRRRATKPQKYRVFLQAAGARIHLSLTGNFKQRNFDDIGWACAKGRDRWQKFRCRHVNASLRLRPRSG